MKKNKPLFFTQHQLGRMAKRGMSKRIINIVVDKGEWRDGKEPFSYEVEYKGLIVILYEQKTQYNVSTCKLNRKLTIEAERIQETQGLDFWKSVHKVVKKINFDQEIAVS